ncbi:hypothetical protein C8R41DRAFT_619814 [Lentinula lateritia]|uniref:Uncharacterized protein n=1 Tax=Lentinula lateritia TaxID=40482 RepID=A0ABQ8V300_9AGAR|nr:hypothetical protein C8R41DRAFT_619814 [Lentinula lateritia]
MFVINALPKTLRILTWLSIVLSIITFVFSLISKLGVTSFFLGPCISSVTLIYLLTILIIEHKGNTSSSIKAPRNHMRLGSTGDLPNNLPPTTVVGHSAYSSLPSLIIAYFLGICWFLTSITSIILLAAIAWSEIAIAAVAIVSCYAATAQTIVWFALAGVLHWERVQVGGKTTGALA